MGIAGLLVSIVSVVIAALAYRRAGQSIRSKLRLNLRNADNELRTLVASLPNALTEAKVERESATTMMGSVNSSAMARHKIEHGDRERRLSELRQRLSNSEQSYAGWSEAALESALVERTAAVMDAKQLIASCAAVKEGAREEMDRSIQFVRDLRNSWSR